MPEGDTIFRTAARLHQALAGRAVTHFESVFPALMREHIDRPVTGQIVDSVSARGKHLLMRLSGGRILHTHLRMNGAWHVYRTGERWRRPFHDMRLIVRTERYEAVGFNVPAAAWLTPDALSRHPAISTLGEDLLADTFDTPRVVQRILAEGRRAMDEVLLDQRVVAGIGNVFKSEVLFMARVHPDTPGGQVPAETLTRLLTVARKLLRANVAPRSRQLTPARGRRTTGRMHPDEQLWVYGRANQPCFTCGTPIECRPTGPNARLTYWCPGCQIRE